MKRTTFIVALIILIFIRFFSFYQCMGGAYEILVIFPALFFLSYCFLTVSRSCRRNFYSRFIMYFIAFSLLPSISAKMQGQPISQSIIACHILFSIFIFYFLCKYRVTEKQLLSIIIALSFVFVIIYTSQQFTYPYYWFYTRGDTEDEFGYIHTIEIRNGFYRYFLLGDHLVILSFFIFTARYLANREMKNLLFAATCFLGIFQTGSRQYILISFAIAVIFFIWGKKNRLRNMFIACIFIFALSLFTSEMESKTSEQFAEREYDSRTATLMYIFSNLSEKPLSLILGDGTPYKPVNALGKRYQDMAEMQIVPSDVGIIGYLYQRGICFMIVTIWFYYIFFRKYYRVVPSYLKMFFLYLVAAVMVFPIARFDQCYLLGTFLYLCYLNTKKHMLRTRIASIE